MPSYSLTLEDTSPLISYSPGWTAGTSASDSAAFRYSASTFKATSTAGALATISFNGTGIQIFGAKRDNHGQYQVQVDNAVSSAQSGLDNTGQFQAILFEQHGLDQGKHDVSIMNLGSQFLDIDFITIEGNIGQANQKLFVNTFEDTDPSFSYAPTEAQWTTNPSNLGTYSGSSGHATSNPGSQMAFQFNGDGVSLYGPLSTNGAPYTIEVDGVAATQNMTSISDRYIPQSLLYHTTGLGEGPHRLVVKYQSTSSGQVFAVDYAQVYTTKGSATSSKVASSDGLSGGAIVGIIIAVAIIIGALIGIGLLLWRRKKRSPQRVSLEDIEKLQQMSTSTLGAVQPFYGGQGSNQPILAPVRALTHSSFGPGPATGARMDSYGANAPARTMSISSSDSFGNTGGLSVNTNLGHENSVRFGGQGRYPNNQLGLIHEPISPEDGSTSGISPSDTIPAANLVRAGTTVTIAGSRIPLGPNGYPLEKVRRPEQEQDIAFPEPDVAGPSTSMYPFAVASAIGGSQSAPARSNNVGDCSEGDGTNPPDYAHATGGPRGR